jgi:hypothetical protein
VIITIFVVFFELVAVIVILFPFWGVRLTLGGLFFLFADEVRDLDYQTALQQLMTLFMKMAEANVSCES